ncbi:MAG: F0F1 ATP synthase subunit A [Eubacteriales bacterium]|jgi:ATP synthase F0, A subunit|nr:F0F1 ATP synthase subunit A [Clostridiales bacterium]MDD7774877.1 F0F1 ATP synthase subunit A [Eubacteriales bacterium]MDY3940504.1 F0F1 ATP synthase subunit A [Eubacteriales bacterium]
MGEQSEVLIPLFGVLDITGEVVTMWAILLTVTVLSLIATRHMRERPGKFQNVVETGIEYLDHFFSGILGKAHARKYFFFLGSLFIFIIFANYSGILPGMGLTKYMKAPTSSLSTTLGLGIAAFLFLQIAGLANGVKKYFKRFVSPMFFMLPLLVLDEFIKPASLALRLFGNVFGEETVTEELYGIIPIGVPVIMMALSLLFCAIQAVVFTMLVSIYLSEGLESE